MACRNHQRIFLFFIFMFLFSLNVSYAAWWDLNKGLPVPPATEEVKREERQIAGSKFDFIYYASKLDATTIKKFYRDKLAASNWVEQNLTQDLKQLPGVKIDPTMEQSLGNNLAFGKDNEQLIISFLPIQYSRDNKTKFTVCYGNILKNFQETPETPIVLELMDKPKKNVAPVYPGAALVLLSEQEKTLRASYSAKAEIEDVLAFYKENMSSYGWALIDEAPLDRRTAENTAIELRFVQLDFTNQAGSKCSIMASSAKGSDEGPSSLSVTTILVDYAEKK